VDSKVRGVNRGRGEVFKEAGAFGPRLLEFLRPLSAIFPPEWTVAAERPTGLLREGQGVRLKALFLQRGRRCQRLDTREVASAEAR